VSRGLHSKGIIGFRYTFLSAAVTRLNLAKLEGKRRSLDRLTEEQQSTVTNGTNQIDISLVQILRERLTRKNSSMTSLAPSNTRRPLGNLSNHHRKSTQNILNGKNQQRQNVQKAAPIKQTLYYPSSSKEEFVEIEEVRRSREKDEYGNPKFTSLHRYLRGKMLVSYDHHMLTATISFYSIYLIINNWYGPL